MREFYRDKFICYRTVIFRTDVTTKSMNISNEDIKINYSLIKNCYVDTLRNIVLMIEILGVWNFKLRRRRVTLTEIISDKISKEIPNEFLLNT